jgi:toxin-antitoxin system PIN domain toxin
MLMPDVNILVYSHRREDPDHEFYQQWMEDLANGREMFALSTLVAIAFVRIVTNPVFRPIPTPLEHALAVVDSLVAMPSCLLVGPGEKHWQLVRTLCQETGSLGKHVADAQHAAVALGNGCTWVTRDSDFDNFRKSGLRVQILSP